MDQNEALRTAKDRLEKQAATIEEQKEKLAEAQRRQRAEDIVEMKIASGTLDPADFLDERDRLVNSDTDLKQTKTAMQEAGPGYMSDDRSIVDVDESTSAEKEASETATQDHIAAAKEDLASTLGSLGAK
jgi:multidrug resistance efflux pump